MKKILVVLLIAVIGLGVWYLIYTSGNYVAKVGNSKIENHEYMFFLLVQKITTESEAGAFDEQAKKELWENPEEGEDPIVIVMNQALENAKELEIQLIKAKEANFKLSSEERKNIQQYLNNMLKIESNVRYVKEDLGLSLSKFSDIVWKSELAGSFANYLMEKESDSVTVSEEEAKAYYENNKSAIDEFTVRYLVLLTGNLTEEQKTEKKKLADDLLTRIKNGEDMAALVREYSEDSESKENDGLFTFLYEDESFETELKDWASGSKTGESAVVETRTGIYVARLENKKGFDDKKAQIVSTIKSQKLNEFYYDQLEEWKNDPEYNLVKNEKVLNKITDKVFSK
ncbi:MAG: peptidylprolyl isomerase [Clostridiaceae bacterium]|nr:peptidylprolyl isomerase [Clostridiaceae bacterium]